MGKMVTSSFISSKSYPQPKPTPPPTPVPTAPPAPAPYSPKMDTVQISEKAYEKLAAKPPAGYVPPRDEVIKPPTMPPTKPPTVAPTKPPTAPPTVAPTKPPTAPPTVAPTKPPTAPPTVAPTKPPTAPPTVAPTKPPTKPPTAPPTVPPTVAPTKPPTVPPTIAPTVPPTQRPEPDWWPGGCTWDPSKPRPTVPPTVPPIKGPVTAPKNEPKDELDKKLYKAYSQFVWAYDMAYGKEAASKPDAIEAVKGLKTLWWGITMGNNAIYTDDQLSSNKVKDLLNRVEKLSVRLRQKFLLSEEEVQLPDINFRNTGANIALDLINGLKQAATEDEKEKVAARAVVAFEIALREYGGSGELDDYVKHQVYYKGYNMKGESGKNTTNADVTYYLDRLKPSSEIFYNLDSKVYKKGITAASEGKKKYELKEQEEITRQVKELHYQFGKGDIDFRKGYDRTIDSKVVKTSLALVSVLKEYLVTDEGFSEGRSPLAEYVNGGKAYVNGFLEALREGVNDETRAYQQYKAFLLYRDKNYVKNNIGYDDFKDFLRLAVYRDRWKLKYDSGNEKTTADDVKAVIEKFKQIVKDNQIVIQDEMGDPYENFAAAFGPVMSAMKPFTRLSEEWLPVLSASRWERLNLNGVQMQDLRYAFRKYVDLQNGKGDYSGYTAEELGDLKNFADQFIDKSVKTWFTQLMSLENETKRSVDKIYKSGLFSTLDAANVFGEIRSKSNDPSKPDDDYIKAREQFLHLTTLRTGGKLSASRAVKEISYSQYLNSLNALDQSRKNQLTITENEFKQLYAYQDYAFTRVVTEFGDATDNYESVSVAADLIPILGTYKAIREYQTGKDWITGEEIPKWAATVGLLGASLEIGVFAKWGIRGIDTLVRARAGESVDISQINRALDDAKKDIVSWFKSNRKDIEKGINEAERAFRDPFTGLIKRKDNEYALVTGNIDELAENLSSVDKTIKRINQRIQDLIQQISANTERTFGNLRTSGYFDKTGYSNVSLDITWSEHLGNFREVLGKEYIKGKISNDMYLKTLKAMDEIEAEFKTIYTPDRKKSLADMLPDMFNFKIERIGGKETLKIEIGELKEATFASKSDTYTGPLSENLAKKHEIPQLNNYVIAKKKMEEILSKNKINSEVHLTFIFDNKPANNNYLKLFREQNERNKEEFQFLPPFEVEYAGKRGGARKYWVISTDETLIDKLLK